MTFRRMHAMLIAGTALGGLLFAGCGGNSSQELTIDMIPPVPSPGSPVLSPIGNKIVSEGATLNFTVSATDPDPGDTLTYSLEEAPAGADIGAASGVFTWTPTPEQVGEHTFTVRVTDNSTLVLSDEERITVTVIGVNNPPATTTVRPAEIDDVLYNPGMGFADFHFGWGTPPDESVYPRQTVAYFRWTWEELEPLEGQYNFSLVDDVIAQAEAKGETLAFRIMTVHEGSTPQWVLDKGVASVPVIEGVFPDHNNPVFLEYHERLVKAFGDRYAGRPEIDHVDIGSIGCWGEWNTACCEGVDQLCEQYFPVEANKVLITDWYFQYFPNTPLVMLSGGLTEYAASKGAGWRGDCFGDYGIFSPDWNHMDDVYEPIVDNPVTGNVWKIAPVQFEVCGVMQNWYDRGFDIDLILQKGLDWHMSVLNAKSSPVPAAWRPKVDEFLKKVGYRFVLRELTHTTQMQPGDSMLVQSFWENKGVAPIYHPWPLAYRLRRANNDEVVATWRSQADLESWLPGTHSVEDIVVIPANVPPATYSLDVAILTEDASAAHVEIAIDGKRPDKWYPVSDVTIGD